MHAWKGRMVSRSGKLFRTLQPGNALHAHYHDLVSLSTYPMQAAESAQTGPQKVDEVGQAAMHLPCM